MNQFAPILTEWSAGAASALLAAIWEGALLAGLVWLGMRFLPRLSAAARSVIWLNVFFLMALLHLVPLFSGAAEPQQAVASHEVRLDPRWSLLIGALWLALSLFRAWQLAAGALHLCRLARRAQPITPSPDLETLLQRNGNKVTLCTSDDVARPSVLGFFRPRILIPPDLAERLTPAELSQVIVHEMEHLRRGDDWTNLIQKLALVLFPLNPALAWVERRLCAERELACDDRVLHAGSGRKAYAMCLAHLAEYSLVRRGFGLVLGAWEKRPELVQRVHRILRGPVHSMGRGPALAATGLLVLGRPGLRSRPGPHAGDGQFCPAPTHPRANGRLSQHGPGNPGAGWQSGDVESRNALRKRNARPESGLAVQAATRSPDSSAPLHPPGQSAGGSGSHAGRFKNASPARTGHHDGDDGVDRDARTSPGCDGARNHA